MQYVDLRSTKTSRPPTPDPGPPTPDPGPPTPDPGPRTPDPGLWTLSAFAVTFLLVLLATLPPFLPEPWRLALMDAFAPVCHQIPDRSPHIDGVALAVCHRCYGVYLGLPLAALAFLLFSRLMVSKKYLRIALFASLALLALDWGAPLLGIWHNTAGTRMITGLMFGGVAGWYLVSVLELGVRNPGSK